MRDIKKIMDGYEYQQKKAKLLNKDYYTVRSIAGCSWAIFYALMGGREAGKSYAVMRFFIDQWKKKGTPFTWMRLTEVPVKKLLENKASKLIDPDIARRYDLDITVKGNEVYDGGKLMCRVMALSTFYTDKGVAMFDNESDMWYNVCLDEINREGCEKNTFDISYAFVNQMENFARSTKEKIRVFLIGNTLQDASDILCLLNYIPEKFGRYYIRKKRAVIDYIPPSERYLKRREGTIADLLMPESSTFTNVREIDNRLITKRRLNKPTSVIKFARSKDSWFTVWDSEVIKPYNGEKVRVIPMRPYFEKKYVQEDRDAVLERFDAGLYRFKSLYDQKVFVRQLEMLKPTR